MSINPANKACYNNKTQTIPQAGSKSASTQNDLNYLNNQLDANSSYDSMPEPETPNGVTVTSTNGTRNIQYMGGFKKNKIKITLGKDNKLYYFKNKKRIKSPFS